MINSPFYKDINALKADIDEFKLLEQEFHKRFGLNDIVSNSKIYEIVIADKLGHRILPKMSNSKDAKDSDGGLIEYKHYKESSSNHSWTFNDFSDTTIASLKGVKSVIFAHFNDISEPLLFDWYYSVDGEKVSEYLSVATQQITNSRKMINVSPKQIETNLGISKSFVNQQLVGEYNDLIQKYIALSEKMEIVCGTHGILTSNKLWEVIVGIELGHKVNSEQGGRAGSYDAEDVNGGTYEYKVAKKGAWNFQDISENVLNKYLSDQAIICAIVNKEKFEIQEIYSIPPQIMIPYLRDKLLKKKLSLEAQGKKLRRLQVSVSKAEILKLGATSLIQV